MYTTYSPEEKKEAFEDYYVELDKLSIEDTPGIRKEKVMFSITEMSNPKNAWPAFTANLSYPSNRIVVTNLEKTSGAKTLLTDVGVLKLAFSMIVDHIMMMAATNYRAFISFYVKEDLYAEVLVENNFSLNELAAVNLTIHDEKYRAEKIL